MATKTLRTNVNQAVQDFDNIKQAIIDKGVEIPNGTPTSEYATKIGDIQGGNEELNALIEGNQDVEISVPKDITKIKPYAFYQNKLKENLTISNNITSIGDYAFSETSGLKNVIFNTNIDIPQGLFSKSDDLETLVINEGVKNINPGLVNYCTNLRYVSLPKTATSFKGSDSIFYNCPNLTSIGQVGGGYSIEYAWDTEIPSNAFIGANYVTEINIPEGIQKIGFMSISSCIFTSITLPQSLQECGGYSICGRAESITIPKNVIKMSSYTLGSSYLKSVKFECNILKNGFSNSTFGNSKIVETIEIESMESPSSSTWNIFCSSYIKTLKNLIINGTITVTSNYLDFNYCTALTVDSLLNILNALEDNTGKTTYTVNLGSTNLAKLTDEQKQIAIDKNYTLA